MNVLAVDPGRDKCGLAVLDEAGGILHREVAPTNSLSEAVLRLVAGFAAGRVLLGNGTGSKRLRPVLERALTGEAAPILEVVDERRTTERARAEFWRAHPPRGIWRLVPLGLRVPDRPYDDFAAVVMARDWLDRSAAARYHELRYPSVKEE